MEILDIPKISAASFDGDFFIVIADGKMFKWNVKDISLQLTNASEADRNNFMISPSGYGIHWPSLNEDLSIHGLLKTRSITYNSARTTDLTIIPQVTDKYGCNDLFEPAAV